MAELKEALRGLRVVDLGRGMPTAIATRMLAGLGATVHRFEPEAGDPFYELYPAYPVWHSGAEVTRTSSSEDARIAEALTDADVCILGGEDFPGYDWAFEAASFRSRYPQLVILEIEGYPSNGTLSDRPSAEILVQARSGACFEQYSDRPIRLAFDSANYGAALNGLSALFGALCRKERDGDGEIARASLYEGALTITAQYWFRATAPSGSFHFMLPKDPYPLVFKCRDGRYIHFVLGSFGSKGRVYRILQIDDPTVGPDDSGVPTGRGEPRNFYGDVDVLAAHVANFDSADLIRQMLAAGVACSYVLAPGECWDDPQVAHFGLIETDAQGRRHVGLPMHGTVVEADPERRLRTEAARGALPLAGVRALDFGMFVAGPYGSVALADLGADVIKVDAIQGDPNRNIFRTFAAANRGKRAIAIDMKSPEGLEIARRLAGSAHILHNNFRPGASARLGVDPATQHAVDPDKIVLEATGFGRTGPEAERAGFDMIFQAYCGHEVRAGGIGNAPMWERSAMVDFFLGALNGFATLVATWRRFRGAGGADLELSLLDSGLFLLSELVRQPDGSFAGNALLNRTKTGYHPAEALYRCSDGWIAIAARSDAMAVALADALAVTAPARAQWGEAEQEAISAAFAGRDVDVALALLNEAGVWAERCAESGESLLEDDSVSPGIVGTTQHAVYGDLTQVGALFRLGDGRPVTRRGPPVLGQDTREILNELGYTPDEIEGFYARKIVA